MSRVWDAIKQVERQREVPGRQSADKNAEHPIDAYVEGVRRRWQERSAFNGAESKPSPGGKQLKL